MYAHMHTHIGRRPSNERRRRNAADAATRTTMMTTTMMMMMMTEGRESVSVRNDVAGRRRRSGGEEIETETERETEMTGAGVVVGTVMTMTRSSDGVVVNGDGTEMVRRSPVTLVIAATAIAIEALVVVVVRSSYRVSSLAADHYYCMAGRNFSIV